MYLKQPFSRILLLALTAFVLAFSACDTTEPEQEIATPDPVFNIASVNTTLADGTDGIQFAATSNVDVNLVKVTLTNPLGTSATVNLGNATAIAGQNVPMQEDDFAFFRVSGNWTFTFVGNHAVGDKSDFTVTSSLNVGA